ncbi:MAG: DNA-3-methyladenine glycosylase, partial [Actinomycetota bacterium]
RLSEAKAAAIQTLARAVTTGTLDLDALRRAPDDVVERALCELRGIGPWTAHMFLIFHLRRPDVWPIGDYGVRQGFKSIFGLAELPTPRALGALGEPYRPHRSAVAWYCWRAVERGRAPVPRSNS